MTDQKSTWDELRSLIQARWDQLTHEDLDNLKGRISALADLVQQKYGITIDEAKQQVSEFEQGLEEHALRSYQILCDKVNSGYRGARRNVEEFVGDVRDFGLRTTLLDIARHNPVITIVTAFTLGFLLRETTRKKPRW